MECGWCAQASYSGRIAPPGRPNTSVTPSASRQRMIASAPVMRLAAASAMGGGLSVRVVGELSAAGGVVLQLVAHGLAHLPGGIRPAAVDLVGRGDAPLEHGVDRCGDGPADVAPAQPVGQG